MNHKLLISLFVVSALLFSGTGAVAQSSRPLTPETWLGTGFTYQGQLKNAGGPVNGLCDVQFSLWDATGSGSPPTGGTQIGTTQALAVTVTNGLFTVVLNSGSQFGNRAFIGEARWLQIAVRCPSGSGAYTTLSPRQTLTPAPMALALPGLYTQLTAASPNIIGGYIGNVVSPTIVGVTISGGGGFGFENQVLADYTTVGGGRSNVASGTHATVGGGGSSIASGPFATVAGGVENFAGGDYSTVGGGSGNTVPATFATISGGVNNFASGIGAFVGGGGTNGSDFWGNQALGGGSTIGGGLGNVASGLYATVPGGAVNTAQGQASLAAGTHAQALHNGSFVWGDWTGGDFASTANNQFLIRANGGVGINTNAPTRMLDVNGVIGVFDSGTRTYYGGLASEVSGQLVELGINDSATNRFGGTYNPVAQGGLFRVDARGGQDLFQFYGRPAGSTAPLTSLAILNASGVLYVAGGYHGTCRTDGNVSNGPICNQDVAEAFAANQLTEPGDVVVLETNASSQPTVRKSTRRYEARLVGVVSTNPGLVFDNGEAHLSGDNSQLITANKTVVAALGRVPVKVSLENGAIAVGDPLAASSTPGAAMKATQAGQIIGYALQSSDEIKDGKLLMWLQVGDHVPAELIARVNDSSAAMQEIAALREQVTALQQQNAALDKRLSAIEQAMAQGTSHSADLPLTWPLLGGLLAFGVVFAQRARR